MGQKIHPTGFRLAVSRNWASRWYANSRDFAGMLNEDIKVRAYLRKKLRNVAGIAVYMRPIQNLQLGGRQSKSRYQYTLQSVSADALNEWAGKLQDKLRGDPIFRDVTSDSQNRGLQATLAIDRDKAALLGVQMADMRSALYSAFGERQVSTIYGASNSFQVLMEAADADRQA